MTKTVDGNTPEIAPVTASNQEGRALFSTAHQFEITLGDFKLVKDKSRKTVNNPYARIKQFI